MWHGEGIKVLGTPVGSDVFVQSHTNERLEEEDRLWEAIGWVPDAQCAWQILRPRRWNAEDNEDHLGKTPRGCHTAERG